MLRLLINIKARLVDLAFAPPPGSSAECESALKFAPVCDAPDYSVVGFSRGDILGCLGKVLTMEEARRVATNITKLPALLRAKREE